MSTDQPIATPIVRPIWTPDDYEETRRDAAKHQWDQRIEQYAAQAALYAAAPVTDPEFVVTPGRSAFGTGMHEALMAELGLWHLDPQPAPTSPARGRHRAPESAGMRPRRALRIGRVLLAIAAVVLVLAVGALWAATRASAIPANCQQQFWLMFGASTRTICDAPTRPDGSWLRAREFWTPEHYVRGSGYCSRYSCSYSEGYWQPTTSKGVETYIVTPETVLADEPGHLG